MPVINLIAAPDPACPGRRHYASAGGYYQHGCRCPQTVAVVDARRERIRAYHAEHKDARRAAYVPKETDRYSRRDAVREIDDCPAEQHRHSIRGYRAGCRCPSTMKAYDRWRETNARGSKAYRARQKAKPHETQRTRRDPRSIDLRRADKLDAEAISYGYRLAGEVSNSTLALAIKMMRARSPEMSDRQVLWRLEASGHPMGSRQLQRVLAVLAQKETGSARRGRLDRSTRAA